MTAAVGIGPVPLSPASIWHVVLSHLAGHPARSVTGEIVWEIRVPRVLLAALVGAALTTAGTVVQVLVRNALADPFLLGISSGASVGATAVLLFGALASLGLWAISAGSIIGALAAMLSVFAVARQNGRLAPTQLILCGVVMAAFFEAITSFLIGASFMVLADLLARAIVAPQEMPIGVITAFIGAPALLVLIRRRPYLYGAAE